MTTTAPRPSQTKRRRQPRSARREPTRNESRRIPLFARETADEIHAIGLHRPWYGDLYHFALHLSWPRFLLASMALYAVANALFALLYLVQPGSISNAEPGSFADAFFFSVETIATIGYGVMSPATLYANIVMTIEAGIGLMVVAIGTGLVFARFSRPTARVLFSRVAVIGPHNSVPTLSVRIANQRHNQILQAEVAVSLLRDELTTEGVSIRRFYDLKLMRYRSPVFGMTFTVMHEIDQDSPLHGTTAASLVAINAELVVTASGIDETLATRVHARASYLPHEILWDHRFVDVFGSTEDGRRVIDYRRFHDTTSIGAAP